jgi:hypothetical protein
MLFGKCEAESLVTCSFIGGIHPGREAETDSRAKFGKETIARPYRRPKWDPYYGAQADSGRSQDTQALLSLYSGMLRHAQAQLRLKQQLLTSGD